MRDDGDRKKQKIPEYIWEIKSLMSYKKLKYEFEEETSAN